MSKQRLLSRFTGNGNVVPLIPTRNMGHRVIALVIVLGLVSFGAAGGMRPAPAGSQESTAPQTVANPNAATEFVYFPGQYVNHATEPSEHIQAF